MDAFAENQMGRGDDPNSPQPAAPGSRHRAKVTEADAQTEAAEELMSAGKDSGEPDGDEDLPGMSVEESALIAARWERKKSTFMPVGDPYAEPDRSTPYARQLASHYCTCASFLDGFKTLLPSLFPVLAWAPKLNCSKVKADVIAGLTVGAMLIPQSMSYAGIAGLQPIYGLYTSVLPVITYSLMGTSRQLGVGPVAMVSLLVEVGLKGKLSEEECPEYYAQANLTTSDGEPLPQADWELQADLCPVAYAQLTFLTSFLVGLFQVGAGMLRLGFLVSFLAHPVISGFTSAAAIIIGLSQLQYFMGFSIPKSQYVYETLGHLFTNLDQTQWEQLVLGLTWWFMLWASRKLSLKYKKRLGWLKPAAPLLTCILAILVAANLEIFNGCGFKTCDAGEKNKFIVGKIPSGLSNMNSASVIDVGRLSTVLSAAVSCAVIGYMESIAIAKSLAAKHKYEVDAGQELIALGTANVLGSLTSSYPVTGSFSRSAVNNQVGAQTQLSGLITGTMLLLTIVALTPAFEFLPKYALAAIVIASVTNLVDYKECLHLWKVKKPDCLLWCVAFLGTLFLGVQVGLMLAVGVSLALVVLESVRPQMSVLWRLPTSPIWRNIKQEQAGQFVPGVMVVRIGASMYFANVAFIRDYIHKMVGEFSEAADMGQPVAEVADEAREAGKEGVWVVAEPIRYIVIEMTPVISIDSTALHMLEDMHRDLRERGIRLAFSTVGNRVEDTLERSGLLDKMGHQWLFPSVHVAVQACVRDRKRRPDEAPAVRIEGGVSRRNTPEPRASGMRTAPAFEPRRADKENGGGVNGAAEMEVVQVTVGDEPGEDKVMRT